MPPSRTNAPLRMATSQLASSEARHVDAKGWYCCCSSAVSALIFSRVGSRSWVARAQASSIDVGDGPASSAGFARGLTATGEGSGFGEGKANEPPTGGVYGLGA